MSRTLTIEYGEEVLLGMGMSPAEFSMNLGASRRDRPLPCAERGVQISCSAWPVSTLRRAISAKRTLRTNSRLLTVAERIVINTGPLIAIARAGVVDELGKLGIDFLSPLEVHRACPRGVWRMRSDLTPPPGLYPQSRSRVPARAPNRSTDRFVLGRDVFEFPDRLPIGREMFPRPITLALHCAAPIRTHLAAPNLFPRAPRARLR